MARYIPPYHLPEELYWQTLLEEGPLSYGETPGLWEWSESSLETNTVWRRAKELQQARRIIELVIDGFNRGGLIAHWKGIECFIPASHLIDYPFPADPVAREERFRLYVGRKLRLCIIEVEPARNRILLSERQVAECEIKQPEWPSWLVCGNVCEGEVTSVRPFGAFVDIGPLEGMIHISEISWGRVRHPRDFLQPGQRVKVLILSVDPENQRVGLSLKRLAPNPWDSVREYIQPGDVLPGTVVSVERFGVFVELVNGLEGLLHVSELEDTVGVGRLRDHFGVGQQVRVRVLDIVPEEHRIALSWVRDDASPSPQEGITGVFA